MISADGTHVGFESTSAITAGGTNTRADIYEVDLTTSPNPTYSRVSVSSADVDANDTCDWPEVSTTGRYVVFESQASNLVSSDTNGVMDVFVRDTTSGTTERVSVGTGGTQANAASVVDTDVGLNTISDDGRYVVFTTGATNLPGGGTDGSSYVYLRDRTAATPDPHAHQPVPSSRRRYRRTWS